MVPFSQEFMIVLITVRPTLSASISTSQRHVTMYLTKTNFLDHINYDTCRPLLEELLGLLLESLIL